MNEFFTNLLEATYPILEFIANLMPFLGLLCLAIAAAMAIAMFFDLILTVTFLKYDVKELRKELDKARDEIRTLQYKSLR